MQPSCDKVFPGSRGRQAGNVGLPPSVAMKVGGMNVKEAIVAGTVSIQPSCERVFPGARGGQGGKVGLPPSVTVNDGGLNVKGGIVSPFI